MKISYNGWVFEIGPTVPTRADKDVEGYIYVVTPPYHFRQQTDLTTDYGTPAQKAVAPGCCWLFWFVLSPADAKVASDALGAVIWGIPNYPDPAEGAELVEKRRKMQKGWGEFAILDSRVAPGEEDANGNCKDHNCGRMRWMRFRVKLIVPRTFKVEPRLRPTSARCPTGSDG